MYDVPDVGTGGQTNWNSTRQSQRVDDSNSEENEIKNYVF